MSDYVNEFSLYSLILCSKQGFTCAFERWVTKDALPSIRKTGRYSYDDMNHKYNDSLTFKIGNETDLHTEVVSFLKRRIHTVYSALYWEKTRIALINELIPLKRVTFVVPLI